MREAMREIEWKAADDFNMALIHWLYLLTLLLTQTPQRAAPSRFRGNTSVQPHYFHICSAGGGSMDSNPMILFVDLVLKLWQNA